MRIGNVRAALEDLGGFAVVLEFGVVDEAEIVIETPVVRIVLDAIFHETNGTGRFAGAARWFGGQEAGAELVGGNHVGIERGGDLQQRSQFVVGVRAIEVTAAEILHRAGPVNASHQAVEAQAGALHYLRGIDVESVFDGGFGTDFIDAPQQKNAGHH